MKWAVFFDRASREAVAHGVLRQSVGGPEGREHIGQAEHMRKKRLMVFQHSSRRRHPVPTRIRARSTEIEIMLLSKLKGWKSGRTGSPFE